MKRTVPRRTADQPVSLRCRRVAPYYRRRLDVGAAVRSRHHQRRLRARSLSFIQSAHRRAPGSRMAAALKLLPVPRSPVCVRGTGETFCAYRPVAARVTRGAGADWSSCLIAPVFSILGLSPGIAQTLFAVERLGRIFAEGRPKSNGLERFAQYGRTLFNDSNGWTRLPRPVLPVSIALM